ncbi:TlpA disulfide reductase family protein [Frigoriflavimonas asaccharolytica]|uniref:Thiol-disulfide isomerase/thioredoxin n=1 Tax=Frigoriflavimonas asaccharolytica TaxID=2735899 RepID=A0A8J8G439_9FLAO|nr:TlpA disulfide reductase family protein [Frigoriflavimonas asaccharolytica]NRS91108.1 thiol-disulfide isomerase/thioredoxin [Frigoriflavimonas asaccharolytica]
MKKTLALFCIIFLIISCKKTEQKQTTINGNIPNLPDGTMYLWEEGGPVNTIDSTTTSNGKFKLTHQWDENKEPVSIGVYHLDKKGVKRLFAFKTNATYRNAGWGTSAFYSDSIITINGDLTYDEDIPGYKLSDNIKNVTGPPLKGGKQTEAYYDINGDLFEKIDKKTIEAVAQKIIEYPNSYHLLYVIVQNKNNFTAQKIEEFLKLFKGEITQSTSYKKLSAYNQKRLTSKKTSLPLLENDKGLKTEILDKKYKKHLVIFWPSWCRPCRAEIPSLKKTYAKEKDNVEFVSISIDDDKTDWNKALKAENMEWKKLLVDRKDAAYEALQIQLKLNSTISYTVLIDNNLKILASSVGLSSEEEIVKLIQAK